MKLKEYKAFNMTPINNLNNNQTFERGFHLKAGNEPLIVKGTNWEHDLSKEDFSNYDYVELNGVRFNKA